MLSMRIKCWLAGCFLLCAASGAAAQLTAVWTGAGGTSNWSNALNWDIQLVPCNGGLTFDVIIPAGSGTVVADVNCTITHCTMENGRTLSIPAGSSLTVLDRAEFDCTISAAGGVLEALGPNAAFHGNRARVFVSNGGLVRIVAPEYSTAGITTTTTILSADGAGSLLDLSSVVLLDAGFDDGRGDLTRTHTVSATNGGSIDLSGMETTEPPTRGEDILRFDAIDANSTIELTSLQSIDGTEFYVRNGGRISVDGPSAATYNTMSRSVSRTIAFADGPGSLLDLSSVVLLDAGFDDGRGDLTRTHTVSATNGGSIDLSGMETTEPPARGEDILRFASTGTDSSLALSSLRTIGGSGGRSIVHAAGGATVSLPSLEVAQDVHFQALDGGQIHVNGFQAVMYATTGIVWSDTIVLVDGPGSLLDLSSVVLLNAGFDDGRGDLTRTHTVSATNGGTIDISGVAHAVTPARGEDWLRFDAQGGTINAGALSEIVGGGRLDLQAREQGNIHTGDWTLFHRPTIAHIGETGSLHVSGALRLKANHTLMALPGGLVTIAGQGLFYDHANESALDLSAAIVQFNGAGTELAPQLLEVGGLNIGAMRHPVNTNFAIGRLVVGGAGPTVVRLADLTPNGNCGGLAAEAQYLYGLDPSALEPSGLGILDGSTLVLGGLDTYFFADADASDGERVNDWFTAGTIPYEDGWIQHLDCEADWNRDGVLNTVDFLAYLNDWNRVRGGEPWQNWNPDLAAPCDSLNTADFLAYLNLFTSGCDY